MEILIAYGSTMGNTERAAELVASKIDAETTVVSVAKIDPASLVQYDLILLGCSTWGYGELQDDFIPFFDAMEGVGLSGKKAAVFGTGDSGGYPDTFCAAVDMIEARLKECGADLVQPGLKIDGDVDLVESKIAEWGKSAAQA